MEKRYNKELQERTRAYVEAGTSQAELSRRLGMNNSSSLSRWLNSSYNGDVEKIEKALEEYFRAQEAAEEIAEKAAPYRPAVDYVPTSISEDVFQSIRYCTGTRVWARPRARRSSCGKTPPALCTSA